MSEYGDFLADGIKQMEETQGATFTWAGTEYPCAGGPPRFCKALQLGGMQTDADLVVVVRRELFADSIPKEKNLASFKSDPDATPRTFKIDCVVDAFNDVLRIEMTNPP